MDDKEIKAIVENYGARMYLNERVGTKGSGRSATYVKARRQGMLRTLGNLDTLAQMSEAQLRTHIAEKFAQGTRRKSNDEQSKRGARRRRTWLYAAH